MSWSGAASTKAPKSTPDEPACSDLAGNTHATFSSQLDDPTIEFSALEYKETVFLRRTAIALPGGDPFVAVSVQALGMNRPVWDQQAANLRALIEQGKR